MLQVARNVTDAVDGALLGKRYLILDRDAKYSASFRRHIEESRIAIHHSHRTGQRSQTVLEVADEGQL
jgi:hypothetical protein